VKVNPASYNLSPALQQFYSTLTSHIVGESQQLCLMAVQINISSDLKPTCQPVAKALFVLPGVCSALLLNQ